MEDLRSGAMTQWLSGRQLLSPVCTHVVVAQRPGNGTRVAQVRRAAGLVVRAESASASTSTAEPAAEPAMEPVSQVEPSSEVAPIAPAPKSIINEETILSAITGESKSCLL